MRRSPPRVLEQGATSSLGQRPRRASPWFRCQDGFLPRFLRTACPHPSASPCQCRPCPGPHPEPGALTALAECRNWETRASRCHGRAHEGSGSALQVRECRKENGGCACALRPRCRGDPPGLCAPRGLAPPRSHSAYARAHQPSAGQVHACAHTMHTHHAHSHTCAYTQHAAHIWIYHTRTHVCTRKHMHTACTHRDTQRHRHAHVHADTAPRH